MTAASQQIGPVFLGAEIWWIDPLRQKIATTVTSKIQEADLPLIYKIYRKIISKISMTEVN